LKPEARVIRSSTVAAAGDPGADGARVPHDLDTPEGKMSRFTSFFAILALATTAAAQVPRDSIDADVRAAMDRRSIPGLALTIVREGKVVLEAGYGVASLELDVPVTPKSVFAIASVTKVFTATLVMQAIEQGAFGLDDRLGDLFDVPPAWRPVTVRQMLSHTSGLPDVIANPMTGEWLAGTRDSALAAAAKLPMQFEPGTAWSYNQTNDVLLGAILEKKAGKSFDALVRERLVEPAGLAATVFGDASAVVPGRGPWYSRLDLSGPEPRLAAHLHPIWVTYPEFVHPCAALNTTATELARFVDLVAAGRILSPATVATMWERQTLRDGQPAGMDPETGMGLGWIVETLDGRTVVGGTGGATVAFRHAVDAGVTVVVLTNCQGSNPDGIATGILSRFLEDAAR
jgi:CubicO group peptidase (beta-lactamase class C family)